MLMVARQAQVDREVVQADREVRVVALARRGLIF